MNVAGLRSDPPYLLAHPTRVAMVMARMTILSSVEAAMVLLVKGHAGRSMVMVDGGWWMVAALVAFLSFDFEVQLDMKKAGT